MPSLPAQKSRQLLLQRLLGLLLLFLLGTLLLQLFSQLLHLLIESIKGFLVLLLLIGQGLVMLAQTAGNPFLSDASIPKRLHTNQRLRTTVSY